jgi:hypothetical protein
MAKLRAAAHLTRHSARKEQHAQKLRSLASAVNTVKATLQETLSRDSSEYGLTPVTPATAADLATVVKKLSADGSVSAEQPSVARLDALRRAVHAVQAVKRLDSAGGSDAGLPSPFATKFLSDAPQSPSSRLDGLRHMALRHADSAELRSVSSDQASTGSELSPPPPPAKFVPAAVALPSPEDMMHATGALPFTGGLKLQLQLKPLRIRAPEKPL